MGMEENMRIVECVFRHSIDTDHVKLIVSWRWSSVTVHWMLGNMGQSSEQGGGFRYRQKIWMHMDEYMLLILREIFVMDVRVQFFPVINKPRTAKNLPIMYGV